MCNNTLTVVFNLGFQLKENTLIHVNIKVVSLSLLSIAEINTMNQREKNGEKGIYISLQFIVHHKVMAETRGRVLRKLWYSTVEFSFLVLMFSHLSYTASIWCWLGPLQ